ncbi:MAG TPA: LTA synthase family protein, partial [Bacteroidia bacterium]|nr:LTA synthase family protein [Bacteroidia bacterium]
PLIGHPGWKRLVKIVYLCVNILGLATNCLDMVYFRYTLRRLSWDFLNLIQRKNDFASMASYLYGYWYIILLFSFLIWYLVYFYNRIEKLGNQTPLSFVGIPGIIANSMSFLLVAGLAVIGIRGGLQVTPLSLAHAGEYAKPTQIPLLLNSPFSIIDSRALSRLNGRTYFTQQECNSLYKPVQGSSVPPFRKVNIVFIILESFSKEYTSLGTGKSYTPFLDSLMNQGYLFTNAYGNGKRSAEGIPAILAGVPSLMDEGYPSSAYACNELSSLPNLLKPYGYHSAFFHGGNDGTMNFDVFARMAGFESYYGRQEYNNDLDFDGNWGIWDEPFLQYFAGKLNTLPSPFCAAVFTLSSHDPFRVPEQYGDKFPLGNRTINPCIGYADYALKRFFQTASQAPWFDNTLFILCPDHTGYSDDPYWGNNAGQYQIPLLLYQHQPGLRGRDSTLVQQIDILPTVLSLLHYDKPYFAFGKNAFDKTQPHFAINYRNNMYQLFQDQYLLQFDGEQVRGYYNLRNDSMLAHDQSPSATIHQQEMLKLLKAYIQCYEHCMIQNRMKSFP